MIVEFTLSIFIFLFCYLLWKNKFIDFWGAFFSCLLIILITFFGEGNVVDSISTLVVYIVIFLMSLIKRDKRREIYRKAQGKITIRSYKNVVGKLLLPVIASIVCDVSGFIALLGYSIADSAGSQIGVFSRSRPVLIISFKKVAPGTNGAISFIGTSLGIILGTLIGSFHAALSCYDIRSGLIWGFYGALFGGSVDSILGATIENKLGFTDWSINLASGIIVLLSSALIF